MSQPDNQTDEAKPRPFADVLHDIDRGVTAREITEELRDLIHVVRHNGKGGSVSLTVHVAPIKGHADMVEIGAEVRSKKPRLKRPPAMFFVDRDSRPTRDHPNQLTDPALMPGPTGDPE